MLFAGTLLLFALQYLVFTLEREEPYPAMIQPFFPGHPVQNGVLIKREPAVEVRFTDGDTRWIPFESLLPPGPTAPSNVFERAFEDDGLLSDPDTVAWLKSRISSQFPGQTPAGVDIVWRRATYSIGNEGQTNYSPVNTIHVDFDGKQ
jgi:hypothetical protein